MGKGRKAGARPHKEDKVSKAEDTQPNFSDASVQLFHPAYEGDQASTTVILTVGDEQLAFNCVEGFQRMCSECNAKASRLNAVLMTSITFRTCNGLPGAVISCAEAAKTSRATLNLVGPRGIGRFMNAMAAYSDYVLQELNLNVQELPVSGASSMYTVLQEPVYSSSKLTCHAVLLTASKEAGSGGGDGPPAKRARTTEGVCEPAPQQRREGGTSDAEEEASQSKSVAIYVCMLPSKRGKFDAAKAKLLGVQQGPDFGKLARGEAVTSKTGTLVQPDMCMDAAEMGECVTVIECPTTGYLPALAAAMPSVSTLMQDPDGKRVKTVFHIGPEEVVMHEQYQACLLQLTHCKHIAAEKTFDPAVHAPPIRKAVLLQLQLHLLCPGMIPGPTMLPAEQLDAARKALLAPLPPVDPSSNKRKAEREREPTQQEITLAKKQARQREAREKEAKQKASRRRGKGKGASKGAGDAEKPAAEGKDAPTSEGKDAPTSEGKGAPTSEGKDAPTSEGKVAPTSAPEPKNQGTGTEAEDGKEDKQPSQPDEAFQEATQPEKVATGTCNVSSVAAPPVAVDGKACKQQKARQLDDVQRLPEDGDWLRLRHLEKLVLRPIPRRGVCSREVGAPLDAHAEAAELRDNFRSAVEAAQGQGERDGDSEMVDAQHAPGESFQTVFLGTGAACPSKYRNVTSIYLDFYERGGLLLDCGEASLGQLIRRFGVEDAKRRIKELRAVWISHRHADHHVGVSRVLALRRQLLPADASPLPVFGPPPLRRVLSACNKLEALHYTWVDQYCICPPEQGKGRDLQYCWDHASSFDAGPIVKKICQELGMLSFSSVLNVHCKHSFGFRMVSPSGKTFVFSGDTEKCDNVINAAKEADILIHEATFESDMIADAKFKKHSTIEDALAVAAEAQCKAVVLTHFSQRYPKVGKLADVCEGRAAVAFDMMTVDSQRLQRNSALLVNVLNKFFSEDADEELQRPEATAVAEGPPHAVGEPAVEPQAAHA